ncbi:MAG: hypothetical protein A2Z28_04060 [Chloroflexi bacterium RBG_16_51_9]|nr:MAG: hypothetical protein A2Z28_04060 [Chloroflexi bacterium RBG_16_51_9]
MINQTAGPGSAGNILYFMRVLLFIAFMSMGYSLSRPRSVTDDTQDELLLLSTVSSPDTEWADLPPWQRKASEKAIERYAAAQEKKWRRWNEAMFERS